MSEADTANPHSVSVDIGGSSVRVGLGSVVDGIVAERRLALDTAVTSDQVLSFVASAVEELISEPDRVGPDFRGRGRPSITLSFPGLISRKGVVVQAPNLSRDWVDRCPGAELAKSTACTVLVANDARVATLGEYVFGRADESEEMPNSARGTMVYVGLGTGVGGGVIADGSLLSGAEGVAGELGHVVIDRNGADCGCGGKGCVETTAGGAALLAAARQILDEGDAPRLEGLVGLRPSEERDRLTVKLVAQAAEQGDVRLKSLFDRAAGAIGILVANLVHTLGPDVVILGGGISSMGARMLDPVRQEARSRVNMVPLDVSRIRCSTLGDRAGLLGGFVLNQCASYPSGRSQTAASTASLPSVPKDCYLFFDRRGQLSS